MRILPSTFWRQSRRQLQAPHLHGPPLVNKGWPGPLNLETQSSFKVLGNKDHKKKRGQKCSKVVNNYMTRWIKMTEQADAFTDRFLFHVHMLSYCLTKPRLKNSHFKFKTFQGKYFATCSSKQEKKKRLMIQKWLDTFSYAFPFLNCICCESKPKKQQKTFLEAGGQEVSKIRLCQFDAL